MRSLGAVGQEAAVAAFLRAELGSVRFAGDLRAALLQLGTDERLVLHPDLADVAANRLRRNVLFAYRGGYLGAWFDELAWRRAELELREVQEIRYIDWDYWNELSGGTRSPADGAARLRAEGKDVRYERGSPPLVLVRADPSSHVVVIEGHVRPTALALHPRQIPQPLEALLGEGDSVRRWGCY